MDFVQLLGAALGLVAGLGLWLIRRRLAQQNELERAGRPRSGRARPTVKPGVPRVLHEVVVQGPLLTEIEGGRYEIGDNSATRAEIEAFMARGRRVG